jgi:site-specific recombinase XerD
MNISAHIQFFEQEMKRRNYSDNTIQNYTSCIKLFFSESKSDHPKNIHEKEIRSFLNKLTEPNTQRNYHSAIKKYYDVCLNQKNKFKYIPYAKKNGKLPIVLSVDEIQRMFNACENKKHKAILAILYSCGLRVSELINLKWCHVDRSRMIINIIQAKGNKDRQVPLSPDLIPILEDYWLEFKSKEFVFNGQSSVQYSERSVGEVIKQLANKAGICNKRVYTHLIRHCSFTHMTESGTDINLIQRIAGHSNVKTTNIYLHISHNHISKVQSPLSLIKNNETKNTTETTRQAS